MEPTTENTTPVFLRLDEVLRRTGLKRSTAYALAQQGLFPRPIHPHGTRSSVWLAHEIIAWQQAAMAAAGREAGV